MITTTSFGGQRSMNSIQEPVILSRANLRTVSFAIGFPLGASYEPVPGISKVLASHMTRNTAKHDELLFADLVDRYGIEVYGESGRTSMIYTFTAPPQHLSKAVEILREVLLEPKFDQATIGKITQRMHGSIQQIRSTPESLLNEYTRWEVGYGEDPIIKHPNGNDESLETITVEEMEKWYKTLISYKPFFAAVGQDISQQKFSQAGLDDLLSSFGNQEQTQSPVSPSTNEYAMKLDTPNIPTSNAYIGLNIRGSDPKGNVYEEDLFRSIISGGMSARMFNEIREVRNLSYAPRMSVNKFTNGSYYTAMMDVRPDRSVEALETTIKLINDVITTKIPDDEMNRALKGAQRIAVFVSDSSQTYTGFILGKLLTQQEYDLTKIKAGIDEAAHSDWQEKIAKLWIPKNISLAVTGEAGDVSKVWDEKIREVV